MGRPAGGPIPPPDTPAASAPYALGTVPSPGRVPGVCWPSTLGSDPLIPLPMSLPRPRTALVACAAGVALALPAAALGAQEAPPPPPAQRNAIATNFIGIPFGLFSLEYERATAFPGLTVGVGGSYYSGDLDDDDDPADGDDGRESWAEAKVMYYPGERVFRGFAIGITGGVHSSRGYTCEGRGPLGGCISPARLRTQAGPTLGVLVNYDWLIGRQDRFRVGLGVGAKRVLRQVSESRDVLEQIYPDGRFVIGFTF